MQHITTPMRRKTGSPSGRGLFTVMIVVVVLILHSEIFLKANADRDGGTEHDSQKKRQIHDRGGEGANSSTAPQPTSVYAPLLEYLLREYNPIAPPVCDDHEAGRMHVKMDMWLYQLFDLDEPTQQLTIDVWMEMSWHDCQLEWDPAQFSGIKQVTLPAAEIYFPTIIWYEALHGNFEEGMFLLPQSQARVEHTGRVTLGTQGLLKSFCRIRIRDFPYDTQFCNLTFASWNSDLTMLNLTKLDAEKSHARSSSKANSAADDTLGHSFKNASNGEWDVLGFPSFNQISSYSFGSDEHLKKNFSEVIFQLQLRRKPTFVRVYLIFPCVLLIWISCLTFMLPVESGEKMGMCVTILLAVIVFLLLVAENIPRTSDGVPILGVFFTACTLHVCVSVLLTAVVLNVGQRKASTKMSRFTKRLLRSKANVLFLFHYDEERIREQQNTTSGDRGGFKWFTMRTQSEHKRACSPSSVEAGPHVEMVPIACPHEAKSGDGQRKISGVEETESSERPVSRQTDEKGSEVNEWRILATLLDRIFFVFYLLTTIALTIYIYRLPPSFTKSMH